MVLKVTTPCWWQPSEIVFSRVCFAALFELTTIFTPAANFGCNLCNITNRWLKKLYDAPGVLRQAQLIETVVRKIAASAANRWKIHALFRRIRFSFSPFCTARAGHSRRLPDGHVQAVKLLNYSLEKEWLRYCLVWVCDWSSIFCIGKKSFLFVQANVEIFLPGTQDCIICQLFPGSSSSIDVSSIMGACK